MESTILPLRSKWLPQPLVQLYQARLPRRLILPLLGLVSHLDLLRPLSLIRRVVLMDLRFHRPGRRQLVATLHSLLSRSQRSRTHPLQKVLEV